MLWVLIKAWKGRLILLLLVVFHTQEILQILASKEVTLIAGKR
jgi:hypothetical protein